MTKEIERIRAALEADTSQDVAMILMREEMVAVLSHIDAQQAEIARLTAEVTRPESSEMTMMRTLVQSRGLEIERLRADADQMLETLTGIRNANPREWKELSCEFTEFERWAKARANHSILKNAAMKEAP